MRVMGIKPQCPAKATSGLNALAISPTPHMSVSNLEASLQNQTAIVKLKHCALPSQPLLKILSESTSLFHSHTSHLCVYLGLFLWIPKFMETPFCL